MEQWITEFWKQHGVVGALAAWVVLSSVLNLAFRIKSPAQWIQFAQAYPKLNSIVDLIKGWGVDPTAALEALETYSKRKAELTEAKAKAEQQSMNKVVELISKSKVKVEEDHD